MKLRPYQQECIDKIINTANASKILRQAIVMSTGSGKTVVFGQLPSIMKKKGKKTLILAHREELLEQAKEKILKIDNTLKIEIEQASRKAVDSNTDVVIASVPTIGRKGSKRIEKFNPDEYGLIIVDECIIKNTFIACYQGYKKIQDIQKGDKVWTYNEKIKKIELKSVLKLIIKRRKKSLIKIKELTCTNNHKIFSKDKGWQDAKNIYSNSQLIQIYDLSSNINIREVFYGCLLGDSNVNKMSGRINFGHCEEQLEYLKWKKDILKRKYNVKKIRKVDNSKGYNKKGVMYRFDINNKILSKKLSSELYTNNKRVLKESVLNKLGAVGLAVWIQDDGCCLKNRINLGTYRYGKEGTLILLEWLKKKYNIIGYLRQDKRQKERFKYFIIFNVENSLKLYAIIFPFIHSIKKNTFDGLRRKYFGEIRYCSLCGRRINHLSEIYPNLHYKVKYCQRELCQKTKHRVGSKFYKGKSAKDIYLDLKNKFGEKDETEFVYDLSVKDNHNYFADGILVHNCHHATSESYRNVLRYFNALKNDAWDGSKVLLGFTATPHRADHIGLDTIVDEIVFNYPLRQAIDEGYLANIKAFSVTTKSDISKVKSRMGDFSDKDLEKAVNNEERNRLIIESYQEITPDTKALVFAVDVQHTKDLCYCFNKAGILAKYVLGFTDKVERKNIVKEFKEGKIKVLINCGCFTEGYDEPKIETILMARPTKSSVLYSQCIGRGTRLTDTKKHLNLIDFVDNIGSNHIITLPSLFGCSKTLKGTKGKLITEIADIVNEMNEVNPDYDYSEVDDWTDEERLDKVIKEIDIFAQAEIPEEVKNNSKYSWEKIGDMFSIKFPPNSENKKFVLELKPNMLNRYEIKIKEYNRVTPNRLNGYSGWQKESENIHCKADNIEDAFKEGDALITSSFSEYSTMFNRNSKWRKDEPTEKQINMLRKFNIPIPKGLTKGNASVIISKKFNERKNNYV